MDNSADNSPTSPELICSESDSVLYSPRIPPSQYLRKKIDADLPKGRKSVTGGERDWDSSFSLGSEFSPTNSTPGGKSPIFEFDGLEFAEPHAVSKEKGSTPKPDPLTFSQALTYVGSQKPSKKKQPPGFWEAVNPHLSTPKKNKVPILQRYPSANSCKKALFGSKITKLDPPDTWEQILEKQVDADVETRTTAWKLAIRSSKERSRSKQSCTESAPKIDACLGKVVPAELSRSASDSLIQAHMLVPGESCPGPKNSSVIPGNDVGTQTDSHLVCSVCDGLMSVKATNIPLKSELFEHFAKRFKKLSISSDPLFYKEYVNCSLVRKIAADHYAICEYLCYTAEVYFNWGKGAYDTKCYRHFCVKRLPGGLCMHYRVPNDMWFNFKYMSESTMRIHLIYMFKNMCVM